MVAAAILKYYGNAESHTKYTWWREVLCSNFMSVPTLLNVLWVTQKLATFINMTLKNDRLTLKMTSGDAEDDAVELAVLKTPTRIQRSYLYLAL